MAADLDWYALDRGRRRAIARVVRRGGRVRDPRDAPYAVAFADAALAWLNQGTRFRPIHLLLAVLFVAETLFSGWFAPALILWPALVFGTFRLLAPRQRRRLMAARSSNAELAREFGLSEGTIELRGQTAFRGLRRAVAATAVLFVLAFAALTAVAAIRGHTPAARWAAAADRVCDREREARAQFRRRRGTAIDAWRRENAIEAETLGALARIEPRLERNRLRTRLLVAKRDKLAAQELLLQALEDSDQASAWRYYDQAQAARRRFGEAAAGLGARTCVGL
jgi:hypothetical protein